MDGDDLEDEAGVKFCLLQLRIVVEEDEPVTPPPASGEQRQSSFSPLMNRDHMLNILGPLELGTCRHYSSFLPLPSVH